MRTLVAILMMITILPISNIAYSQVLSICENRFTCTSQGAATIGIDSNLRLTWLGEVLDPERQGGMLTSTQGRFMLENPFGEQILGRASTTLTKRLLPAGNGLEFRLNERLSVPGSISALAAQAGVRRIYYVRDFQFEGSSPTVAVQIIDLQQPVPGRRQADNGIDTASGVEIQNLVLTFETGTLSEVIRPDMPLKARARIRFRQAGRLNAIWEVATPVSTVGQPLYVPLEIVNRYISGSDITLLSPPLPSTMNGLHRLRLRIISPRQMIEDQRDWPTLSYRVSDSVLDSDNGIPALDAWLGESTDAFSLHSRFYWRPVSNAYAYQLEFYPNSTDQLLPVSGLSNGQQQAELAQAPSAGQLFHGQHQSASPSSSLINQLQKGQLYLWRLVAIDRDGTVIAASPLESIRP